MNLAAGIVEPQGDDWYNSLVVFNNQGEISALYRKLNLFPLTKEKELFKPGDVLSTVSINGIKFGLMICFDIRFPEIARQYLRQECDGLIIVSGFPVSRLDHWRYLLKSLAIHNQMYVIGVNRTGRDGSIKFAGNSCILNPWGTVKAMADVTGEEIIKHNLNQKKVAEVRETMPCRENLKYLDELFK